MRSLAHHQYIASVLRTCRLHQPAPRVPFYSACLLASSSQPESTRWLQLLGAACVWVAAKLDACEAPSAHDMVALTLGTYTTRQLVAMERRLLQAVSYQVQGPPTCHAYLSLLLRVNDGEAQWGAVGGATTATTTAGSATDHHAASQASGRDKDGSVSNLCCLCYWEQCEQYLGSEVFQTATATGITIATTADTLAARRSSLPVAPAVISTAAAGTWQQQHLQARMRRCRSSTSVDGVAEDAEEWLEALTVSSPETPLKSLLEMADQSARLHHLAWAIAEACLLDADVLCAFAPSQVTGREWLSAGDVSKDILPASLASNTPSRVSPSVQSTL